MKEGKKMLVQFSFKNYGPFKDEVVFDMRAVKVYKEHPYNLIVEDEKNSFLKVAAIYGANASGKSNFVDAYSAFLNIISTSFQFKKNEQYESALSKYYKPYLFDEKTANGDIEFEAVFHDNGTEYRYGYIFNRTKVVYEWLYKKSLQTLRQTTIIERSPNDLKLGSSVKKTCEKYKENVKDDVLALSFFSSLKLKTHVFTNAFYCVADVLPLRLTTSFEIDSTLNFYFSRMNDETKASLMNFLNSIDVGIRDIEVEKNDDRLIVYTYHVGADGKERRVNFDIESDGTRKAISIFCYVSIAVKFGKGLIIDELNMQLHPLLLKYIIDLIYKSDDKAQLIYTTHDTTLLNRRYMRRDQIWFTSKNTNGESSLYSLAEFKVRNDESFEKAYLGGAYGGIPDLKDFNFED